MKFDAETYKNIFLQVWPEKKIHCKNTMSGRPTNIVQTSGPNRDRALNNLHQKVSQKSCFAQKLNTNNI